MRNFLPAVVLLLIPPILNAAPLAFENARIPEAPPGAQTMAAYMKIVNNDDRERIISSISSQEFGKVEMHESIIEEGIARMQAVNSLKIAAHSSLELAPGGIHLMLLEPEKDFMHGELIVLHLNEIDGTEHTLIVTVKKMQAQHHHHE
jgi:hypothetical protein